MRYGDILSEAFGRYFKPGARRYFAYYISWIEDPAVRQHVAEWFARAFEEDDPDLDVDGFLRVATNRLIPFPNAAPLMKKSVDHLATEISEEPDPHVKEYLTHFVGELVDKGVHNFDPARWRRHCETGSPKRTSWMKDTYRPDQSDKDAWLEASRRNLRVFRTEDGAWSWEELVAHQGAGAGGQGFPNKYAAARDALQHL